ncbi:MAG: prefoldin subunit alpha [Nanoarchaeota archaeon]
MGKTGENPNQELMFKLGMFEQQIQHLQQQLQAVEESMIDLNLLNTGLDEITNSIRKDILAPLGRGIFVEAKLLSDSLTVDVGNRNFVKKTVPQTKKIIDEQIKKLVEIKGELDEKIEEISEELTDALSEMQEESK